MVHDYGDVCQTITELAVESNAPISTADFRTLNRCLDDAIAGAVTVYGRESEQSRLDGQAERGNQRMGFFTHELRNLVNTASVAFEVLKTGNVGIGGSTSAVLERSLASLRDLIDRSLAEVRLTAGIQNRERILVADLIGAFTDAARLDAAARRRTLTVLPIESGLAVEVDQQVLSSVVFNLLQNAFKFSPPHSTITLTVGASPERVLIEVHDECGGLPGGDDFKDLFRPFEQRGKRTRSSYSTAVYVNAPYRDDAVRGGSPVCLWPARTLPTNGPSVVAGGHSRTGGPSLDVH